MPNPRGRPPKPKDIPSDPFEPYENLRVFTARDFACRCGKCGGVLIEPSMAVQIDRIARRHNLPFEIIASARCENADRESGFKEPSLHRSISGFGYAVDLALREPELYAPVILELHSAFNNIRLSAYQIHVDNHPKIDKPTDMVNKVEVWIDSSGV